ncbi:large ribosomal subunit protein bL20m-like isoform X3 [Plodia interpunctella]|uniref:large ribosomal subunit protein bL20m-like isoform X3 n=1 Tax=Plodia interpunctella TaxID=58824 RepID=UPI002368AA03|nr:39S ribosomal protein L20, mitochondrial-like isoform X3 [Plodia interpunctella]XP_053602191.1 39S ribosomal protein L20, mitochondrial-like isoform X3 [Plodia interpunctella]XP_053602192.1 39S ribosomal protein L20, mitochondrial-like isoform X3 [Plodia interpunctella]
MVFLSITNMVRCRGPDEFWRKRKIFRLAAHYIGRRRNCYSVAVRNVHRALAYATKARKLKKEDMKELWDTRITAACEQHNLTYYTLKEGLDRAGIMLDRKSLSDLASWEPQTFKCLAAVAKQKIELDGFIDGTDMKRPTGVNLNLKDVMLDVWLKQDKK